MTETATLRNLILTIVASNVSRTILQSLLDKSRKPQILVLGKSPSAVRILVERLDLTFISCSIQGPAGGPSSWHIFSLSDFDKFYTMAEAATDTEQLADITRSQQLSQNHVHYLIRFYFSRRDLYSVLSGKTEGLAVHVCQNVVVQLTKEKVTHQQFLLNVWSKARGQQSYKVEPTDVGLQPGSVTTPRV